MTRRAYSTDSNELLEKSLITREQSEAVNNNKEFFFRQADRLGYSHPLLLGSRRLKITGKVEDLVFWDWDGLNLQALDYGMHGSRKTTRSANIASQMAWVYDLWVLMMDRKGGERLYAREPVKPAYREFLNAYGLKALGNGGRQTDVIPNFLYRPSRFIEGQEVIPYKLGLSDFYQLPQEIAIDLIEKALQIEESSTESDAKKYDAARRFHSEAHKIIQNQPLSQQTFKTLYAIIHVLNEQIKKEEGEGRMSVALESKYKRFIDRGFFGDGQSFDFLKALKGKPPPILNLLLDRELANTIHAQVYEYFIHAMINEESRAGRIKPGFVVSDEHDIISEAGSKDNLLKQLYRFIASKDRYLGNSYYKMTQMPNRIPEDERFEADFIVCTRLDEIKAKYVESTNDAFEVKDVVMSLDYPKDGAKECALVSKEGFETFYPATPWCQFDETTPIAWGRREGVGIATRVYAR